jgi:hypothetical protein
MRLGVIIESSAPSAVHPVTRTAPIQYRLTYKTCRDRGPITDAIMSGDDEKEFLIINLNLSVPCQIKLHHSTDSTDKPTALDLNLKLQNFLLEQARNCP